MFEHVIALGTVLHDDVLDFHVRIRHPAQTSQVKLFEREKSREEIVERHAESGGTQETAASGEPDRHPEA